MSTSSLSDLPAPVPASQPLDPPAEPRQSRAKDAPAAQRRVNIVIPQDAADALIIDGQSYPTTSIDLDSRRRDAVQHVYDTIVLPQQVPVVLEVVDLAGSARLLLTLDGEIVPHSDSTDEEHLPVPPAGGRDDKRDPDGTPNPQATRSDQPPAPATPTAEPAQAPSPDGAALPHPAREPGRAAAAWTAEALAPDSAATSSRAAGPASPAGRAPQDLQGHDAGASPASRTNPVPGTSQPAPRTPPTSAPVRADGGRADRDPLEAWLSKPRAATGVAPACDVPSWPVSSRRAHRGDHPVLTLPSENSPADGQSPPNLQDLLARRSLITEPPATQGWRAVLRTLSGGLLSLPPGPAEARRREQVRQVQRPLASPKTIVIGNPKGGASKTTSTLLLAAQYGLHRGTSVLAWDNNETRGTLGWASQPGLLKTSTIDLLADLLLREGGHPDRAATICDHVIIPELVERLRAVLADLQPGQGLPADHARRAMSVGDVARYARPQNWGHFHVLASPEVNHSTEGSADLVSRDGFTALHRALSGLYELLVIDTGNNIGAANWRSAVDHADQLIVVSTLRWNSIQSAADMLDALHKRGKQQLIANAITVLVEPGESVDRTVREHAREHFGARTRQVLSVPHDQALVSGGVIDYPALSSRTKDAWLEVAAASAEAL